MQTPRLNLNAFEEMLRGMEANLRDRPRFVPLPEGTFPAASLVAWMALAKEAGVPAVPAEEVARLSIDAVLAFDQPGDPAVAETLGVLERANADVNAETMLRWDCCAGFGVKVALGEGLVPDPVDRTLFPDDPRAFDILYEFPAPDVAVLKRPWIEAEFIDGFPLEFRVFVEGGVPVAVANYYLQRALPDTPAVRAAAAQAVRHAYAVLAVAHRRGVVPAMPAQANPERVAATLDFLVTPAQDVLFLEAGPGHFFGAHPCAFLRPDGRTVDTLEGLRLGVGQASIPLVDLET